MEFRKHFRRFKVLVPIIALVVLLGISFLPSMNAASGAATIEFTTNPSPPHKGGNAFRVKLAGGDGAPVAGAQVTVTFFMPAMPAMGMGAMRVVSNLSDKGGGLYEGRGELESGGTWQVTVVAQKNGQALASKQLRVDAEGGASASDTELPPLKVKVGDHAPEFALESSDGKTIKLSDFAGHNVVIDFYRGYW